ncbi:hypothetical protein AFK68_18225 [Hydrocoleum sp. CS-953]|nr:hypothetical protein AFK68_18225 [Hydrocoleum sp. CS-953]
MYWKVIFQALHNLDMNYKYLPPFRPWMKKECYKNHENYTRASATPFFKVWPPAIWLKIMLKLS